MGLYSISPAVISTGQFREGNIRHGNAEWVKMTEKNDITPPPHVKLVHCECSTFEKKSRPPSALALFTCLNAVLQ